MTADTVLNKVAALHGEKRYYLELQSVLVALTLHPAVEQTKSQGNALIGFINILVAPPVVDTFHDAYSSKRPSPAEEVHDELGLRAVGLHQVICEKGWGVCCFVSLLRTFTCDKRVYSKIEYKCE
jgi:hypothetical protein